MQKYNKNFDFSQLFRTFVLMKLTIVIPAYQVEDTLDHCIESVVGQSFPHFEVILVDDGSSDRTPELCDAWARRDERISVIHKPNGGLSDARNIGIEQAKGNYITFIDSDDFLAEDTYQQVLPFMEKGYDIVEFPIYWQYGSKNQEIRSFGSAVYCDMQAYWLTGRAYEHSYACNKIYRRELFNQVRFPVGMVFEDAWTLPKLLLHARNVACIEQGLYYYCANSDSITAQADGSKLRMLLMAHLQILEEHPAWAADTRYYMHIVNIQIDVCQLTGEQPQLPYRHVNPLTPHLPLKQRAKALLLNLIGLNRLCKLKTHLS